MALSGRWMEVSVSLSNRVRQYSFPPSAPIFGGTQDHTETFQDHVGQDLRRLTEPGVPVGQPQRGPLKFVAAICPFAAVEVQDMLLVTGEWLHVQVFPGVSQLLQTLVQDIRK